jgi:hypothetical protein
MKRLLTGAIAGLLLVMAGCGVTEEADTAPREMAQDAAGNVDKEAQKKTMDDIRLIGAAMFAWLTDQVGAAAAGQQTLTTTDYKPMTAAGLQKRLVPDYLATLPLTDGWGHRYEFYLVTDDFLAQKVFLIRSPGRDGKFSPASYTMDSFDPELFDEDIVWADGFFFRWPKAAANGR